MPAPFSALNGARSRFRSPSGLSSPRRHAGVTAVCRPGGPCLAPSRAALPFRRRIRGVPGSGDQPAHRGDVAHERQVVDAQHRHAQVGGERHHRRGALDARLRRGRAARPSPPCVTGPAAAGSRGRPAAGARAGCAGRWRCPCRSRARDPPGSRRRRCPPDRAASARSTRMRAISSTATWWRPVCACFGGRPRWVTTTPAPWRAIVAAMPGVGEAGVVVHEVGPRPQRRIGHPRAVGVDRDRQIELPPQRRARPARPARSPRPPRAPGRAGRSSRRHR